MNERKSRRCTDGIAVGRDGRRGASRRAEWHAATFSSEDGPFGVRQYWKNGKRSRVWHCDNWSSQADVSIVCRGQINEERAIQKGLWWTLTYWSHGGVICSDLKGHMTPKDRHRNRYLVNFIKLLQSFFGEDKRPSGEKIRTFFDIFWHFLKNVSVVGYVYYVPMVVENTKMLIYSVNELE